jgi:hypothetical protein
MRMAAARDMRPSALGTVPRAAHGAEPVFDPADKGRMPAREMPAHPTRGYHPEVWGYTLELLADLQQIQLENGLLREADAESFAKKAVRPAALIIEAFAWLRQHTLIATYHTVDGVEMATVDIVVLARHLRDPQQARALAYFRGRAMMQGRSPWIAEVLQRVEGA